jgi:NADP-dependent 3-hydroxy acid dehydrogenase YdfG
VSARRAERLKDLVARIEANGGEAIAFPGNVAEEAVATATVEDTLRHFGRLDILINSAGIYQAGGVVDADLDQWRRVLDINLMATLYTCRAAVPAMMAQGEGDIINVTSTAGRRFVGGPYGTSKRAVTAVTQGLRQEVGLHNIRVCMILPGATTTEVAEGITDPAARDAMRQHVSKDGAMKVEDIASLMLFILNLPRRATVDEILIRPTIDVTTL